MNTCIGTAYKILLEIELHCKSHRLKHSYNSTHCSENNELNTNWTISVGPYPFYILLKAIWYFPHVLYMFHWYLAYCIKLSNKNYALASKIIQSNFGYSCRTWIIFCCNMNSYQYVRKVCHLIIQNQLNHFSTIALIKFLWNLYSDRLFGTIVLQVNHIMD